MKKYYFILALFFYSAGVLAQKTWTGSGGDGLWNTASNWSGGTLPISTDIVVLDNSSVVDPYTVTLPTGATTITINRLTITPAGTNIITVILPSGNTGVPGFSIGDATAATDDIIINNGGVLKNSSTATSGNGIETNSLANGTLRINNGAKYIHNTARSTAGTANQLSIVAGTETGIFEYDSPGTGSISIAASGKIFGSLVLTRTAGAATYTSSGGSALTIRGNFIMNAGITYTSSMTGAMKVAGNFTNNGTALTLPAGQAVSFNGTTGNQTISGSGSITFGEDVTITSTSSTVLSRDISILTTKTLTVNGDLDCGTNAVTGAGAFSLAGAGTLRIGSPVGITSFAASGNIQVTGIRTFSPLADYRYKGVVAQVTGDQLPSSVGKLFINNASGVALTSNITVSAQITLGSNGTLSLGASTLTVGGALTRNSGYIDASSSTVSFTNTALITLVSGTFNGNSINSLTLNGVGGVTLSSPLTVIGNLTLTNGNVNTSGVNFITYTGVGAGGGGSAASHINGPMARTGGTGYIFPVGSASLYRPISVSGLSGSATIKASYIPNNPFTAVGAPYATGIDHISSCEYWDLDDGVSTVTGIVGLQFGGTCNAGPYVDDPPTLLVAHWNGTQWDNLGNDGSATLTNVAATSPSTFSPFTLGSSSTLNPLPITIDYFNGTKQSNSHMLNWKVNCYNTPGVVFSVERSTDGRNYAEIYSVAATALRCQQPFDYTDTQPAPGTNFYRLKMTDANGKTSYSGIIALLNKQSGFDIIGVMPNPVNANGKAILNITSAQAGSLQIVVTDMSGNKIMTQTETLQAGSKQVILNLNKLSTGTYLVTGFYSDGTKKMVKILKQ